MEVSPAFLRPSSSFPRDTPFSADDSIINHISIWLHPTTKCTFACIYVACNYPSMPTNSTWQIHWDSFNHWEVRNSYYLRHMYLSTYSERSTFFNGKTKTRPNLQFKKVNATYIWKRGWGNNHLYIKPRITDCVLSSIVQRLASWHRVNPVFKKTKKKLKFQKII
jgi:hypothetical protein